MNTFDSKHVALAAHKLGLTATGHKMIRAHEWDVLVVTEDGPRIFQTVDEWRAYVAQLPARGLRR